MRRVLVITLLFLFFTVHTLCASPITIVSEGHHVWGHVQELSYDYEDNGPVSGSASEYLEDYTWGLDGWVTASSATGRENYVFNVHADCPSEGPWMPPTPLAVATIVIEFIPNYTYLHISFDGITGDHTFESWIYFILEDLGEIPLVEPIEPIELDSRTWAREYQQGWVIGEIPDSADFDGMQLNHQYRMTIGAHAKTGDQRTGYAALTATIIPEPGTVCLLGLGGLFLRIRRGN